MLRLFGTASRIAVVMLLAIFIFTPSQAGAAPRESIGYTDGSGKIYRINPDGSEPMRLVTELTTAPSRVLPNPAGNYVVSYTNVLLQSGSSGAGVSNISTSGYTYSTGYAFSPDGSKISFSGKTSTLTYNVVYVMNADGTGIVQLRPQSPRHQQVLDWGSAGILVRDFSSTYLTFPLYRVDPSTGTRTLLSPEDYNIMDARYSPDGSKIVMSGVKKGVTGGNRIFTMNANGTGLAQLATNPITLNPNSVAWAYDGTNRIVVSGYDTIGNGIYHIYLVDVGTGAVSLLATNEGTSPTSSVFWGLLEDPLKTTVTTIASVSGQYSDPVTLSATLTSGGVAVSGKSVTFSIDGVVVGTAVTNLGGIATLSYVIDKPQGTYAYDAAFAADIEYGGSSGTDTLTVTRENATLTYTGTQATTGGSITLSASLTESDGSLGNRALAGTVQFVLKKQSDNSIVDTKTALVTAGGTASIASAVLTYEPHIVEVTLLANDYYTALPIGQYIRAATSLVTSSYSGQYSDVVTLTATLTPTLSGEPIVFTIGPTVVGTVNTDAGGIATLNYTIIKDANAYDLVASYAGDFLYTASSDTQTLTVTQETAVLSYTGAVVSNGGPFTLQASLAQQADGSLGNITLGGTVEFRLYYANGADAGTLASTHTAVVDALGLATKSLVALAARSYDVEIRLLANGYFAAPMITAVIQTQPIITVSNLTGQYSDPVTLQAVMTADGGFVSGRTITFTIDGVAAGSGVTDAGGAVAVPYSILVGNGSYPIVASFAGDGSYSAATGSGTLSVIKENATIVYTGTTATSGGALTLSATVTEEVDATPGTITNAGSIQFIVKTLGGVTVDTKTAVIQPDGTASVASIVLPHAPYDITIDLIPNSFYTAPQVIAKVKAVTSLVAADVSGQFSDVAALSATLTPAVSGKTVTFMVNGVAAGSGVTNASGVATSNYLTGLGAGTYPIVADFAGDASYTASSDTKTLTVSQEDATLAYTGETETDGGIISLSATVTQAADGSLGDITLAGTVQFVVKRVSDGVTVDTQTSTVDATGLATATTVNLPSQPYTVDVTLLANNYYTAPAILTTIRATATLTVAPRSGQYSDDVTISATLTDGGGGVTGKTVSFTVNGVAVGSAVTDGTGLATLAPDYTIALGVGTYPIAASFAGDATYAPAFNSDFLTVTHEDATLAYTGDAVSTGGAFTLEATVTQAADGSLGDITLADTVEFRLYFRAGPGAGTLASTHTATVDASGTATLNLPSLAARSYDVEVELLSNNYYTAPLVTAVIQTVAALVVDDISGQYSDSVTLRATLTADATSVVGRTVTFTVNGVAAGSGTTAADGSVTVPYSIVLGAGSYPIVASFAGDGTYTPATGNGTLTVLPEDATLAYTGTTATTGGTLTLSATLTQSADGALGTFAPPALTIEFVVKDLGGVTVDTQTAAVTVGGTVSTTSVVLPNQPFDVFVTLVANDYYLAPDITAKVQATTTLIVSNLGGQYSDSVDLQATLSPAGAGNSVSFTVDGVAAGTDTTDAGGLVSQAYLIELAQGSYPIDASFAGNDYYTSATDTGTLTVTREDATLEYTGTDYTDGTNVITLSASITEAADGSIGDITLGGVVRFKVIRISDGLQEGPDHTASIVLGGPPGSGTATVVPDISLPGAAYTVEVTLDANDYYTAAQDTGNIRGVPLLSVAAVPSSVQYSDQTTLSATLLIGADPVVGKLVTFTVNGVAAGSGTTNASGQVSVPYTVGLGAGDYPIVADFAGDVNYEPAVGNNTLTVMVEDATLTYTGDTVTDGNAFTLQAQVTQAADGNLGTITLAGTVEFTLYYKSDSTLFNTYTAPVAADGTATVNLPALIARRFDVEVRLLANDYFAAPMITQVLQTVPALTVDSLSGQFSDNVTLSATLEVDGAGISGKTVTFTVNGVAAGSGVTDANGLVQVSPDYNIQLGAGSYTIVASFAGDGDYLPTSGNGTLTVTQEAATLAYTGQTVTPAGAASPISLSASVTQDADGSLGGFAPPAVTIEFVIKNLSGVTVDTQTASVAAGGTASVSSVALPNEPYTVEVTMVANDYYTASPITATIKATATIAVDNLNGQYSDDVTLRAVFSPATAGKTVTFTVDGVAAGSGVTDAAGEVTVPYSIQLGAGSYAIVATFVDDGEYLDTVGNGTLTVTQEDATLTYTGTDYTDGTNLITLSATIVEAADGTLGAITDGGQIRFRVKRISDGAQEGPDYTAAIVASGVPGEGTATVAPAISLPGAAYTVEVILDANDYYTAPMATGNIRGIPLLTVSASPDPVQYSDQTSITATLLIGADPVSGKTVTLTVDGVPAGSGVTDAFGQVQVTYTVALGVGSYPIVASFAGDANYDPATGNNTLTVQHEDATLAYIGDTVTDGSTPFTLEAQVTQAADGSLGTITLAGTVEFTLYYKSDGTLYNTYTAAVAADGTATVNLPSLPARSFDAEIRLLANDYYVAPMIPQVIQTVPSLTVDDLTGQFSDDVTLSATLAVDTDGVVGRTVTFTVNGVAAGSGVTDANGFVTVAPPYNIQLPVGSYTIAANFAGDADYLPIASSGTLTVVHEDVTLVYTGQTVMPAGAPSTINLSVTATEVADGTLGGFAPPALSVQFVIKNLSGVVVDTKTASLSAGGVASATSIALANEPYTVEINLVSNNYYAATPLTVNISATASVATDDVSGQYSDEVTLRAVFSPATAGKTIDFTVDGVAAGSGVTDAAGEVTIPYPIGLGQGSYAIVATFTDDGEYTTAVGNGTLTVTREGVTIVYDGQTVMPSGAASAISLSAVVTEAVDGSLGGFVPPSNISVQFVIKNLSSTIVDTQTAAVLADGTVTATSIALPNFPYTIEVTLVANDYYTAPLVTANLQATTSLTVDDLSGQYSDGVTLSAVMSPAAGGLTVSFMVDGTPVGSGTTDGTGTVTRAYTIGLPVGSYTIQADFAGDANYTAVSATGTLTVTHENATLAYTGDTEADGGAFTLQATVTQAADGSLGTPITLAGTVQFDLTFTSDGTPAGSHTATVAADGTATVNLVLLAARSYDVTVTLLPNNYYTAAPAPAVILAVPFMAVDNLSGQYSDSVTLTATLTEDGIPISGKTVTFTVDGVPAGSGVTNAAGVVTVAPVYTINLGAGTYPIVASFAGDAGYLPTSGNGTLNVTQEDATLAYTGGTVSDGGAFTLGATVSEAADGSLGNLTLAGTVEFRLYYKAGPGAGTLAETHTGTVDASGVVTVNLGSLAARSYDVEIELLANDYYTAPQITAVIQTTPVMVASGLSGQYSDSVTLEATITADTVGLSGQTLSFSVNGVAVGSAVTDGSGVANLPYLIDLAAGSYTILVEFAGDGTYTAVSDTATLAVTQENATLAYTGQTVMPSGAPSSLALSATVTQSADGNLGTFAPPAVTLQFVVRNLGGTIVDTKTASVTAGGTASVASAALTSQPYTVEVSMVANGYYVASPVTTTITADPTLTTADGSVEYSDQTTVSGTLSDGVSGISGKTISFTVNGVAVGSAVTNASGVATLTWTNLGASEVEAGSHALVATFAGDVDYTAASDTKTMTVSKETTTVTYTGPTEVVGGSFALSATVVQSADGFPGDITKAVVSWTVTRNSDSVVFGTYTASVLAGGTASQTIPSLPAAGYTITTEIDPANLWFTGGPDSDVVKATPVLTTANKSVQYSDQVGLDATLTFNATGVTGKTVSFTVNGVTIGTAVTNASGVATLSWTNVGASAVPAGSYAIGASFAGDVDYNPATATDQTLTVTKEDATVVYTGATSMSGTASPQNVTLSASVTQSADGFPGDITLATVQFTVTELGGATTLHTAAVDAGGMASITLSLNNNGYDVVTRVDPANTYYTSPSVSSIIKANPALVADDASGGQYSDLANLQATLTRNGIAVVGESVEFRRTSDNVLLGTAVTNASGLAQLSSVQITGAPGVNTNWFTVSTLASSTYFNTASDTGDLTVTKEDAVFFDYIWSKPGASSNLKLGISLREDADASYIAGNSVTVEFSIESPDGLSTFTCGSIAITLTGTPATGTTGLQNCGGGNAVAGYKAKAALVVNTYYVAETVICTVPASGNSGTFDLNTCTTEVGAAGGGSSTMSTTDTSGSFGETTTLSSSVDGGTAFESQPVLLASLSSDVGHPMMLLANSLRGGGAKGKPVVAPGLVGQPIYFYIEGKSVGHALIEADGSAKLKYRIDLPEGRYRIEAKFMGYSSNGPGSATGTLTVKARSATLSYTGETTVAAQAGIDLGARLHTDLANLPNEAQMSFTVKDKATGMLVGTFEAPIQTDGTAARTVDPLPPGEYEVTVRVVPDGYFNASPVTTTVIVSAESP